MHAGGNWQLRYDGALGQGGSAGVDAESFSSGQASRSAAGSASTRSLRGASRGRLAAVDRLALLNRSIPGPEPAALEPVLSGWGLDCYERSKPPGATATRAFLARQLERSLQVPAQQQVCPRPLPPRTRVFVDLDASHEPGEGAPDLLGLPGRQHAPQVRDWQSKAPRPLVRPWQSRQKRLAQAATVGTGALRWTGLIGAL